MATISGRVIFDRDRSATVNSGDSGLANVPVVLQNITTNARLVVLTDANGNYSFTNVPNGSYRIVESYGASCGVPTPGDFSIALPGELPTAMNPPISIAPNPPVGSTNLDSLTPDTILVTVTGADLTNENFLDGPIIYTPIETILDNCTSVSNTNLIQEADDGTFGFFPAGTSPNTGAPTEPYPEATPDFTYAVPDPTRYTPFDGEYTVQNTITNAYSNRIGAWWRFSDHTTGNETGRMMIVNGYDPGSVFFRDTVTVQSNRNYLFSSWILNLFTTEGYPNPALGVRMLDENGGEIYSADLGVEIPVNTSVPEWKEVGTVINSQNNSSITVEFISQGEAAVGNDYAIDDISLREIIVPEFTPVKTISQSVANIGDTVTYTVTLENTCTSPLTDVSFQDTIAEGLEFIPGSVRINRILDDTANPNDGFNLPDVSGESTVTVTFDVLVRDIPNPNPASNIATVTYSYTPVEGGSPSEYTVDSNEVLLEVNETADISVRKTGSPNPVNAGELLTYRIVVSNVGPLDAASVVLRDSIPTAITNVEFSTNEGQTWNPWEGSYNIGTLANGSSRAILIRGIVSSSATGFITNTATVTTTTPDPDISNNTSTSTTSVEADNITDVSVRKTASPNPVNVGERLTYTVEVSNAGPSSAENIVLRDNIPSTITNVEFSTNEGQTWNPWEGSYNIGTLANGSSRTILIRGVVSSSATGSITNTATVTTTTIDLNPANNTSTITVQLNNNNCNCNFNSNNNNNNNYYINLYYNKCYKKDSCCHDCSCNKYDKYDACDNMCYKDEKHGNKYCKNDMYYKDEKHGSKYCKNDMHYKDEKHGNKYYKDDMYYKDEKYGNKYYKNDMYYKDEKHGNKYHKNDEYDDKYKNDINYVDNYYNEVYDKDYNDEINYVDDYYNEVYDKDYNDEINYVDDYYNEVYDKDYNDEINYVDDYYNEVYDKDYNDEINYVDDYYNEVYDKDYNNEINYIDDDYHNNDSYKNKKNNSKKDYYS